MSKAALQAMLETRPDELQMGEMSSIIEADSSIEARRLLVSKSTVQLRNYEGKRVDHVLIRTYVCADLTEPGTYCTHMELGFDPADEVDMSRSYVEVFGIEYELDLY